MAKEDNANSQDKKALIKKPFVDRPLSSSWLTDGKINVGVKMFPRLSEMLLTGTAAYLSPALMGAAAGKHWSDRISRLSEQGASPAESVVCGGVGTAAKVGGLVVGNGVVTLGSAALIGESGGVGVALLSTGLMTLGYHEMGKASTKVGDAAVHVCRMGFSAANNIDRPKFSWETILKSLPNYKPGVVMLTPFVSRFVETRPHSVLPGKRHSDFSLLRGPEFKSRETSSERPLCRPQGFTTSTGLSKNTPYFRQVLPQGRNPFDPSLSRGSDFRNRYNFFSGKNPLRSDWMKESSSFQLGSGSGMRGFSCHHP